MSDSFRAMLYYISEGGRKLKVLLYFESEKMLAKSGIGRALDHQKRALKDVGVSYTLDNKEDYDILHINTYGINSHNMVNQARRDGKKSFIMHTRRKKISVTRLLAQINCRP